MMGGGAPSGHARPAGPWQEQSGLRWRILSPFGVEIDGDLSRPLPEVAAELFAALFRDHGLIVAHGQSLGREEQEALGRLVGSIVAHRDGESGFLRSEGTPGATGSALSFHSDTAYTDAPFEALSLFAVDVVAHASSTIFVNAQDALDDLPQPLRDVIERYEADMMSSGHPDLSARLCDSREVGTPGYRSSLPAVRINPRNGRRYIAVSEMHTAGLIGMDWADGRTMLNAIFDHLYQPVRRYEHRWVTGDFVLWDNLACQHARGALEHAGLRVLQRVIVGPKSWPVRRASME